MHLSACLYSVYCPTNLSIHKHLCNAPFSISYNVSPLHSITSPAILYTHNFNIPWWAKFSALTNFQMHSNVQKLNTPNIVNNDQLIIICLFVQTFYKNLHMKISGCDNSQTTVHKAPSCTQHGYNRATVHVVINGYNLRHVRLWPFVCQQQPVLPHLLIH